MFIQGPLFDLRISEESEIGGSANYLQNNLKSWGIHSLNSVIISRVLRFLSSQSRFQSQYDEIFNIDRIPFSLMFIK